MTPQEKAQELYEYFGDKVDKVTEEIIGALYDEGRTRPQYWYDVQEEINKIQENI